MDLDFRFRSTYRTPPGFSDIVLASDGAALTAILFAGSPDASRLPAGGEERGDLPVFREARRWLDLWFAGREPDFEPPHRAVGETPFRAAIAAEMRRVPWGATTTYGAIAAAVARRLGRSKMSAQAVGQAVGWNPLCLLVPCHRVLAASGLGGYGGGLANKRALLALEGISAAVLAP